MSGTRAGDGAPPEGPEALRRRLAELEQVEAELRGRLALHEQIQGCLPDLISVKDANRRILFANKAFCDFYGKTLEQIRGLTEAELTGADRSERHGEQDGQVFEAGIFVNIPSETLERYDGKVMHFHTVRCPVRDGAGKVARVIICSRGIQADASVSAKGPGRQGAHNELLLNLIPDLHFRIARDGTYLDFSAAKGVDTALPPSYFLGKKMQDVTPDLAPLVMASAEAALQTGEMQTIEFKMYVHGAFLDYEARILVSGPDEVVSIVRDVTQQKRVEQQLREAEARFRSLDAQSMVGVYIIQGGRPVYANPGLAAMYGCTPGELAAQDLPFALVVEEDRAAFREIVEGLAAPAGGPPGRGVQRGFRGRRRDGTPIHIDAYVAPTVFNGEAAIIGMVTDVTGRHQAEAERQRLQEEVMRMQLMELSTPLIPISERVMVMPIIGTLDDRRALLMMERLLLGVTEHRAEVTIVDITGIPSVTTQTAAALIRCAQAVRMLGARVLLTGIRPDVAKTIVDLGVDLGGIVTLSTLKAGIAYAMKM
ncbi:MAG TPA: PAS domain S-box protein [Polyangiaceae bacterium]|nr:PAS domain S-box protein [Polyangiaceae bacterium]